MLPLIIGGLGLGFLLFAGKKKVDPESDPIEAGYHQSIGLIVTNWPSAYSVSNISKAIKEFLSTLGGGAVIHKVDEYNGSLLYVIRSKTPVLAAGETVSIDDGNITFETIDTVGLF